MKFTLPAFSILAWFATQVSAEDALSPDDAFAFLDTYCLECHDSQSEKGDVNLEAFLDHTELRQLFDVYDQTVLEYMPPLEEKQPSLEEREAFVATLENLLAEQGHDRKLQPGYGNYVKHEELFTPNDLTPGADKRVWRIDPSAMADIANYLIGFEVYRWQRQGVTKEHPSFTYRAPAHAFQDFADSSYFENTTTELALNFAKEIAGHMEHYRFQPQQNKWDSINAEKDEKKRAARIASTPPLDRIGETYQLLFNREISEEERAELEQLEPRWAIAALILRSDAVFRVETTMDDYQVARTIGFSLAESGPDPQLFEDVANRPFEEVLDERMMTDAFDWRLVRFLREYFEYGNAPNVFKDPEDLPPSLTKRDNQYRPERHVEDADHFCYRIVREDENVLKQLLTSNLYSVRGGLNSSHVKILKRASQNGYLYGYHGIYGIEEQELPPWRSDFVVPNRLGILHHPAWLISFSDNEKNQAIQRGRWITTKLLGGYVPDAPVEVDASLPMDDTLTLREKMEVTRTFECWACHRHMDDQGLPFEQFDFIAHFRETELDQPVDVTGLAMGEDIEDPYAYVRMLSESRRVQQMFLRHAFRFFTGRNESVRDANTLIAMEEAYQAGNGSLKDAVKTLFLSDSYLKRH